MDKNRVIFLAFAFLVTLVIVGLSFSWQIAFQVFGILAVAFTVFGIIGLVIFLLTKDRGPCIG